MQRALERLASSHYDLVVVGGGIYGACAAWDAALRGLSVALVEQGDFGHATSANSLKIIHGGLRYLQSLDVARMRESIRERRAWLRIAPHLVRPQPFLVPTYGAGIRSRAAMAAAFLVNDAIGWDRNHGLNDPGQHIPNGRVISKSESLSLVPGLLADGLTGGALWHDGQVYNSERLTLAVVRAAADAGADVANYLRVTGVLRSGARVIGIEAEDAMNGARMAIRARVVLNTAGPWAERVVSSIAGTQAARRPPIRWVKALNLVTRPLTQGVGVGVSGRAARPRAPGLLFITPWRNQSVIGTRYVACDGDRDHIEATEDDIQRLLDDVNDAYPAAQLTRRDVTFVHAGLLPAESRAGEDGVPAPQAHYQVWDHKRLHGLDGFVSVVGVKYTTARDVAERSINLVFDKLGKPAPRSLSRVTPVAGGRFDRFEALLAEARLTAQASGLDPAIGPRPGPWAPSVVPAPTGGRDVAPRREAGDGATGLPVGLHTDAIRQLVANHGSDYRAVLQCASDNPALMERVSETSTVLKAQVVYAVRHEAACTLPDVVFRRTELGSAGYPGDQALHHCALLMAWELGWDTRRIDHELNDTERFFVQHGVRPLDALAEFRR